jgi:hypothetical protein
MPLYQRYRFRFTVDQYRSVIYIITIKQCCESGFILVSWIRTRNPKADPDPGVYK